MIKVYVSVPTTGTVVDGQEYIRRRLAEKYKDKIELVYPEKCTRRIFHDFARSEQVKEFLKTDCEILWFLDSDITPPDHILDLVTEHGDKWQVAGAPYPVWMTPAKADLPQVVLTVYQKNPETGNLAAADVPRSGGTAFVDGLATGCLFIKRKVLEDMPVPHFEFTYDAETRNIREGEDLGFCRKLNSKGIQFFTDYSMVCKHEKKVCLLDVNNYAIDYANRAVLEYDARIKDQLKAAIAAAKQVGFIEGQQTARPTPTTNPGIQWLFK